MDANELAGVVARVTQDPKALPQLIRISYAKDTLAGWRAILAVGMAARALVHKDREFLRETCRKLLWSLSDESGGIGWSAPELLGEIVSADPHGFRDMIPLIAQVYDVEETTFRPGVVYALRRIAESAPELVLEHQRIIIASLADPEPLVKVFGLQLAGLLWKPAQTAHAWSPEYQQKLQQMVERARKDNEEAWVYQEEGFTSMVVKEVAESAVEIIN